MRFFRLSWILPLLAASGLQAAAPPTLPLGDNEMLTYRVSWSVLFGAGELKVAAVAATDPTGAPLLRIISTTATRGIAQLILPFQARSESLFEMNSGHLLWLGESSETRSKHLAHTVTFDYAKHAAEYVDSAQPQAPRSLSFPAGFPSDIITCLLQTRTWNLKPGESHDAVVIFDDEFFELTVHATGYETIMTPRGEVRTLVLEPRMEKSPPKGMFRRGSTVKVWIAQDATHLPVRFRVQFNFGAGTATLVNYRPPAK